MYDASLQWIAIVLRDCSVAKRLAWSMCSADAGVLAFLLYSSTSCANLTLWHPPSFLKKMSRSTSPMVVFCAADKGPAWALVAAPAVELGPAAASSSSCIISTVAQQRAGYHVHVCLSGSCKLIQAITQPLHLSESLVLQHNPSKQNCCHT